MRERPHQLRTQRTLPLLEPVQLCVRLDIGSGAVNSCKPCHVHVRNLLWSKGWEKAYVCICDATDEVVKAVERNDRAYKHLRGREQGMLQK